MEDNQQQVGDVTPPVQQDAVVTPDVGSEPVEKMIPQSEVNRIVGRTRQEVSEKAYEKARKELESQRQTESQPASVGGVQQLTAEQINQLIDQRADERARLAYAEQVVNTFAKKLQAGSEKYKDFDQVVGDLNLADNPSIVQWAGSLDNTADVMYDLGRNPEKYANLLMLTQTAPNLAVRKLQQLSDSIKRNHDAQSQPRADEPLDHLKHSGTGTDNGSMSVSDLRQLDWLRA